ncbi:MAG: CHASE2 domain-containing protein [Burkholderiaceae bacterium]
MQRVFIEWCAILVLLVVISLVLSTGPRESVAGQFQSLDTSIYDLGNRLRPLEADNALAIIEIDEASLAQIGRWPWPRGLHAALLGVLTDAGARVIGIDILMAESARDDELLAQAISRAPPVVLPVASETDRNGRAWPIYPVHETGKASHLGHAHFSFDRDGVVRGLYLEEGGNLAFSISALAAAGIPMEDNLVATAAQEATNERRSNSLSTGVWDRSNFALVPASKPVLNRYSYAQVLRGEVDRKLFADKVVLIGATATGMRDAYSNAIMAEQTVSAGIDLHAAAFNALSQNKLIQRAPFAWHTPLIISVVLLTMLILYFASPRIGLAAVAAMALVTIVISIGLLQWGYWLPPGGTVLALLTAYPLWSWRRLESVVSGLIEQSRTLEAEPELLGLVTDGRPLADRTSGGPLLGHFLARPGLGTASATNAQSRGLFTPPADPIAIELTALRRAATRVNSLRLLLVTALERLPHAALISGIDGRVLIRNRLARESFPALGTDQEVHVWDWLAQEFNADELSSSADQTTELDSVEKRDSHDRDWLIDAHHVESDDLPALWLIQLTDISRLRALQREREEMMRFISHDLRSPQISILSELRQTPLDKQVASAAVIQAHAEHSLALAESFIQWTRAENKPFEAEPIDLVDLVDQARDAAWSQSKRAGTPIDLLLPDQAATSGDPQLLRRAIGNLIENAIKYGGTPNRIIVKVSPESRDDQDFWLLSVMDEGPGLGSTDTERIFDPYVRGAAPEDRHGTGLGLAFVRMVAERHGGYARAWNRSTGGAAFSLTVPTLPVTAGALPDAERAAEKS